MSLREAVFSSRIFHNLSLKTKKMKIRGVFPLIVAEERIPRPRRENNIIRLNYNEYIMNVIQIKYNLKKIIISNNNIIYEGQCRSCDNFYNLDYLFRFKGILVLSSLHFSLSYDNDPTNYDNYLKYQNYTFICNNCIKDTIYPKICSDKCCTEQKDLFTCLSCSKLICIDHTNPIRGICLVCYKNQYWKELLTNPNLMCLPNELLYNIFKLFESNIQTRFCKIRNKYNYKIRYAIGLLGGFFPKPKSHPIIRLMFSEGDSASTLLGQILNRAHRTTSHDGSHNFDSLYPLTMIDHNRPYNIPHCNNYSEKRLITIEELEIQKEKTNKKEIKKANQQQRKQEQNLLRNQLKKEKKNKSRNHCIKKNKTKNYTSRSKCNRW